MAQYGGSGLSRAGSVRLLNGRVGGKPTLEKQKSVAYNATTSDQIFAISASAESSATEAMPSAVEVENVGGVPIFLMIGYRSYTDDTSDDATDYLHVLLQPGSIFTPPVRAVISSAADSTVMFGTAVDNLAPSSVNSGLLWFDSTANLAAHVRPSATDPITITLDANETNLFRVGDLIQIGRGTSQTDLTEATYYREILRVQSITDTEDMVCERALYGTDAGDYDSTNWSAGHAIGEPVYLPFHNGYHDVDKYTVAQSNSDGAFKCFNFFGQGRSVTESQGVIPGSFSIKFFNSGYQSLSMSGVSSSSNTGLTASTLYGFDCTVDGSGLLDSDTLQFTTDSSNLSWGGSQGVLSKINAVFNTQFYTTGSAIQGKRVSVGIENGDIVFRSGQRLSTSAILLAAPSAGETTPFGVGAIPAIGDVSSPVAARLPDDVIYDPITYTTSPNTGAFGYDNGSGSLFGGLLSGGSIDYETGALDFRGPPNAEFVVSALTNSAFSGKVNEGETDRINSMVEIKANTPSQKSSGSVVVRAY